MASMAVFSIGHNVLWLGLFGVTSKGGIVGREVMGLFGDILRSVSKGALLGDGPLAADPRAYRCQAESENSQRSALPRRSRRSHRLLQVDAEEDTRLPRVQVGRSFLCRIASSPQHFFIGGHWAQNYLTCQGVLEYYSHVRTIYVRRSTFGSFEMKIKQVSHN